MTDTNEQKWMADALEACESHKKNEFDLIRPFEEACFRSGYLAARKKAHSEREDAFKAFTLDLADRYEKEIEKRDKLLEQAFEIVLHSRARSIYPTLAFNTLKDKKK